MQHLYDEYRQSGLEIVSVNVGNSEGLVRIIVEEERIDFPVVLTGDGTGEKIITDGFRISV